MYDIDVEGLTNASAAPDFIVTQDLCEVCADSLSDVRAAVSAARSPDEHSDVRVLVRAMSLTRPARLLTLFVV